MTSPHLHLARHVLARLPRLIVGVRLRRVRLRARSRDAGERRQRLRHRRHCCVDHEVGVVHAAQLFGARVNVHELLRRDGRRDEAVAARRDFAEPRAENDDQIRILDALGQFWIDADADIARIKRMRIVEQILRAEFTPDSDPLGVREAAQVSAGRRVPAAAACKQEGALCASQHVGQLRERGIRRRRLDGLPATRVHHLRASREHVFGQREHDGPHAPARSNLVGARNELGNAIGAIDLRHPFRHRTEHAPVVDFLKRLALHEVAPDLPDEENHRRRILKRSVHADRGVRRAGSTRDEAQARRSRELAVRLGHVRRAALVTTGDQIDPVPRAVQRIEHWQIALAWNAEREIGPMNQQLVDEDLPAAARACLVYGHAGTLRSRLEARDWVGSGAQDVRLELTRNSGRKFTARNGQVLL